MNFRGIGLGTKVLLVFKKRFFFSALFRVLNKRISCPEIEYTRMLKITMPMGPAKIDLALFTIKAAVAVVYMGFCNISYP